MVENITADFSRDSDGGSERDTFEMLGSRFSVGKHDGLIDQQDKERYARESHCEIERRRRNKMTAYINELCEMVPTCSSLARKPDKLTILRMAVSHMKSIRGVGNTGADGSYKPSFLSDQELKHLVLEAADGFLFVCQCDTGRIIYVSDSVTAVLNQTQSEWYQHTLYELCHPDDAEKICEQLTGTALPTQGADVLGLTVSQSPKNNSGNNTNISISQKILNICDNKSTSSTSPVANGPGDLGSNHLQLSHQHNQQTQQQNNSPSNYVSSPGCPARILDLKTGTVKKEGHQSQLRGHLGARRGFMCRMRLGSAIPPTFGMQSDVGSMGLNSRTRLRYRNTFRLPSTVSSMSNSSSSTNTQCSYAIVHVTGFVKHFNAVVDSPITNMQQQNGQEPKAYPLFDGLIPDEPDFGIAPHQDLLNRLDPSNNSSINDLQVPQCFVALGRLQLTNRPDAPDLCPRRTMEFMTRHSVDTFVTFCDHRVENVLGLHSDDLLGQPFGNFIISQKDKADFQDMFDRAWKFKGQTFVVLVNVQSKLTDDSVPVRCNLSAFVNPYSEEVEYIVCTTSLSNQSYSSSTATNHYTCSFNKADSRTMYWKSMINGRTSRVGSNYSLLEQLGISTVPSISASSTGCFSCPTSEPLLSKHSSSQFMNYSMNSTLIPASNDDEVDDNDLNCSTNSLRHSNLDELTNPLHVQTMAEPNFPISSSIANRYLLHNHSIPNDYVNATTNYDTKQQNPSHNFPLIEADCSIQDYKQKMCSMGPSAPNDCLVQSSELGLNRPSAICYLPSDSLNECGYEQSDSISPHSAHYISMSRPFGGPGTYLPSIDPTSTTASVSYGPNLGEHHAPAPFQGWYSSNTIQTSESASSLPLDSYQHPHQSTINTDLAFNYQYQYPQLYINEGGQ